MTWPDGLFAASGHGCGHNSEAVVEARAVLLPCVLLLSGALVSRVHRTHLPISCQNASLGEGTHATRPPELLEVSIESLQLCPALRFPVCCVQVPKAPV